MPHRPLALTALGALQFLGFGVACMVLLGDGTLDGELSAADVAAAVGVALLGALVVGSTFSGGRYAWWFELALAAVVIAWGALVFPPAAAFGAVWLAITALPQSRTWFLRPVQ
jgi:hypothetical protein